MFAKLPQKHEAIQSSKDYIQNLVKMQKELQTEREIKRLNLLKERLKYQSQMLGLNSKDQMEDIDKKIVDREIRLYHHKYQVQHELPTKKKFDELYQKIKLKKMEKMQQHDPIETNYEDHVPIMEHVEINHNVVTHKNPVLYPYKPSAPIDGQERRKGDWLLVHRDDASTGGANGNGCREIWDWHGRTVVVQRDDDTAEDQMKGSFESLKNFESQMIDVELRNADPTSVNGLENEKETMKMQQEDCRTLEKADTVNSKLQELDQQIMQTINQEVQDSLEQEFSMARSSEVAPKENPSNDQPDSDWTQVEGTSNDE